MCDTCHSRWVTRFCIFQSLLTIVCCMAVTVFWHWQKAFGCTVSLFPRDRLCEKWQKQKRTWDRSLWPTEMSVITNQRIMTEVARAELNKDGPVEGAGHHVTDGNAAFVGRTQRAGQVRQGKWLRRKRWQCPREKTLGHFTEKQSCDIWSTEDKTWNGCKVFRESTLLLLWLNTTSKATRGKGVCFDYGCKWGGISSWWGGTTVHAAVETAGSRKPRAHIFSDKQEAERGNRKWEFFSQSLTPVTHFL